MEDKYKVGDIVRIKPGSEYDVDRPSNPRCNGVINNYNKPDRLSYCYYVKWDNGNSNSYRHEDLELVDSYKLPLYWFCRATTSEQNCILVDWFNKTNGRSLGNSFNGYDYYTNDGHYSTTMTSRVLTIPDEKYQEITFEQFTKYVLNKSSQEAIEKQYTIADIQKKLQNAQYCKDDIDEITNCIKQ